MNLWQFGMKRLILGKFSYIAFQFFTALDINNKVIMSSNWKAWFCIRGFIAFLRRFASHSPMEVRVTLDFLVNKYSLLFAFSKDVGTSWHHRAGMHTGNFQWPHMVGSSLPCFQTFNWCSLTIGSFLWDYSFLKAVFVYLLLLQVN